MRSRKDRSFLDGFTHIVTVKDVPFLKKDLEFDVSYADERSLVPPIKITFFCDDITCEEWLKEGDQRVPTEMPCYFRAELPEGEHLQIKLGTMTMNFAPVINETVRKFFEGVLKCETQEEVERMFRSGIHLDRIKSLTNVFERKTLIEKTGKHNGKKKKR